MPRLAYRSPPEKPYVMIHSFNTNEVGRAPMAPPQLPRDAPVLYIFEPAIPISLRLFGVDGQLARSRALSVAAGLIEEIFTR